MKNKESEALGDRIVTMRDQLLDMQSAAWNNDVDAFHDMKLTVVEQLRSLADDLVSGNLWVSDEPNDDRDSKHEAT